MVRGADRRAPRSPGITEAVLAIPSTAHILGGAVIGADPQNGVIDAAAARLRLREPARLRRLRGPGELGVNPSLTITAMAERAMTFV